MQFAKQYAATHILTIHNEQPTTMAMCATSIAFFSHKFTTFSG